MFATPAILDRSESVPQAVGADPARSRSGQESQACILHADLDAFYASVAQRNDPTLRDRPVVVGGGVVLAASYEAREFGIHAGMGGRRAKRLCPELVVVGADIDDIGRVSRQVMDVFREFTPMVEPLSPDEAFLDVGGSGRLFGTPASIAEQVRARVFDETELAVSVGVAPTKFLAKVASGVAKPDGLIVVPRGGELAFLHPLPVARLWGVGPATLRRLASRGVHTVGELAAMPPDSLEGLVGSGVGRHLHALGWNRDPRAVQPRTPRRSVGSQSAIGRTYDLERVETVLLRLADRVAGRMRDKDRVARTITVRMRFADDFQSITRSRTLPFATQETVVVHHAAVELVRSTLGAAAESDERTAARVEADRQPGSDLRVRTVIERRGVNLVGISMSNVGSSDVLQLELPFDSLDPQAERPADRHGALDRAVDSIRDKFGRSAISAAVLADGTPGGGRQGGVSYHDLADASGLADHDREPDEQ